MNIPLIISLLVNAALADVICYIFARELNGRILPGLAHLPGGGIVCLALVALGKRL